MNIMSKLRRGLSLLLVAILAFGLVACGGSTAAPTEAAKTEATQPAAEATEAPAAEAETEPRAERVLRMDGMANSGYPSPFTSSAKGAGYVIVQYIFDTLVWKDQNGFFNYLAEDYSVSDDNLTYTFKLREGVLWNDGMPSPLKTSSSPSTTTHCIPTAGSTPRRSRKPALWTS